MSEERIIFTRTFDLLVWLVPQSAKFPREHRFGLTLRLQNALFDFQEALYVANAFAGADRLAHLRFADAHLNKLRLYLRLAHRWHWLNDGQYEHVSRMIAEIGKLLGGWIKQSGHA